MEVECFKDKKMCFGHGLPTAQSRNTVLFNVAVVQVRFVTISTMQLLLLNYQKSTLARKVQEQKLREK